MKCETMVRLVKWTALLSCGLAVVVFDTGCRSTSGHQKRQRSRLMDGRGMIPPAYSEPGTQRAVARPVEPDIGLAPLAPGAFVDEPLPDLALPPPPPQTIVELPPPLESETLTYEVKRGDSLWKIARAYGLTHQELAAFNTMKETDNLLVGRVLRIPPGGKFVPTEERAQASTARPAPPAPDAARPASPSGGRALNEQGHYTVRSGDSLWLIARDLGVKVDDLRRANNLSGDVIHAGQQLVVPGGAARPADAPRPRPDAPRPTPSEAVVETTPVVDEPVDNELPMVLPNMLDYTITDGDSLQNIADMFSIDVEMIRRANPGIRTDADLRPNSTIRVPLN